MIRIQENRTVINVLTTGVLLFLAGEKSITFVGPLVGPVWATFFWHRPGFWYSVRTRRPGVRWHPVVRAIGGNKKNPNEMKTLITLIGLIFVLEGLPYVAFPEAMRTWLRQLLELRPGQLRAMGLVAMAIGLLICYITQRTAWFG